MISYLGTINQHVERKMRIVSQSLMTKVKVLLSHSRNTEWTVSSRIIQLDQLDHPDMRKMPIAFQIGGQRSRLYFHIVGKRLRIPCRQYTDWTKSSRILQLGAEAEDSYCYSRSEVKVILITIKVQNFLNKFIPKLFSNFIMPLWYWKLNITLVFCFF